MFKLVIQDDEGKTTVVPLIRDEITIGRKEGNTIRLTERNVSRRHARILRNNGEVHIEDLGSYNGIRVNNARIAERVSLRVSDQVQIGDYKLYLKAEGLEQVDDAKTVPIERVGSDTSTDVIPAVAPAPTQPMAIPATPAPAAPQLVGNPARTLVAIADTDPHGRPVASAAVVAALTQAAGYGKLVVLSSNFAGKEYELSRPQMIVGRTDENDIVINHRSISRNHAKLVREPESGRYTISDLQSSNGVRVNGQDYGKVELRRGDVVDLGHVRLRFVEPGEDFVFSRDAVITDVPDAGSRKGLMIAIVLGLIVLAGVTIFFLTRGPADEGKPKDTNNPAGGPTPDGPNGQLVIDGPDQAIAKVDPPDAAPDKVDPPVTPPDAPQDPSKDPDIQAARVALADDKWDAAIEAAERAKARNHPEAQDLYDKAHAGSKADAASRRMEDALKAGEYKTAAKELAEARKLWPKIGAAAEKTFNSKTAPEVGRLIATAKSRALSDETCASFRAHMSFVGTSYPDNMADRVRYGAGTCKPKDKPDAGSGSQQVGSAKPPVGDGSGSATTTKPPKNPECTEAKVKENKAALDSAIARGAYAEATAAADKVLACGFDGNVLARGFLAACNGRDATTARRYYKSMSPDTQAKYSQMCTRNGVNLP